MKHNLEEVVRWQSSEVENQFDSEKLILGLENQLSKRTNRKIFTPCAGMFPFPTSERELERSDIEVKDDIEEHKKDLAVHKKNHETPISVSDCILPQMARIRIKESSKKHFIKYLTLNSEALGHVVTSEELKCGFFLLGEAMQASGHIVVISDISGRTIPMLHSEDFEVIPPQEC